MAGVLALGVTQAAFAVEATPDELLPPAPAPEKSEAYSNIAEMLQRQANQASQQATTGNFTGIMQVIAVMVQMMPPDDRQKLVTDIAKNIQSTSREERQSSIKQAAAMFQNIKLQDQQVMLQHLYAIADALSGVERQIMATQLQKLLPEINALAESQAGVLKKLSADTLVYLNK